MKILSSNENEQWIEYTPTQLSNTNTTLVDTGAFDQTWEGFGGCFNELSQIALLGLSQEKRDEVYDYLFAKDANGLQLDFCRIPIGASDYAEIWYSNNENDGDYDMLNFSIERDKKYLLPYIKEAIKRNPEMKFFASPWSPPSWMKFPKVYNYGTLVQTAENLDAYALYLAMFIEEYAKEGVVINQLHIQNEPAADQKFPSCLWTGEEFINFINNHLAPTFEKRGVKTAIWLGTINAPNQAGPRKFTTRYDNYANLVLHDEKAYANIEGVGYQWAGKYAIQVTRNSFPEKKYMQTENECGDGTNTWEYANYVFELFHHYITNGVVAYCYWNMALAPHGQSSWGWEQNSMIEITDEYNFNYEYFVMKHFSAFIKKGAKRIVLRGHFCGTTVAFKNLDGSVVLVSKNPFNREMSFEFMGEIVTLPPNSFNTICF